MRFKVYFTVLNHFLGSYLNVMVEFERTGVIFQYVTPVKSKELI